MRAKWKKRSVEPNPEALLATELLADQLAQEFSFPKKLIEVLVGRGYREREALENIFSPKLKNLRDPLRIRDMEKAVNRLELAFDRGEKICVYADYDLDGSSGLALLFEALKNFGFQNLRFYQPKRLAEGYGVHVNAIEQLNSDGVQVVVTVDVGITAFEALKRAKELEIDVIVTDHHLPLETLPEAFAVVNPNCSDCTSGLGHLSGAGVAFYLVMALKRRLSEKQKLKNDFDPKTLLDFFTIGTLTDMVPLIGENRSLVRHGLTQLSKTNRPGLQALLLELGLAGRGLTSQDVAIQFAPKLNALSRMEIGLLPVDLFFVETEAEAREMVSTVSANNKKRKDLQAFAEAWALEQCATQVQKGFAFICSDKFHKGIIGLVATRLSQRYGVPAFVGAIGADGEIVGSARVPDRSGVNLLDVFEFAKTSLGRFGGHAKAAGFALSPSNQDAFERALVEFFKSHVTPETEFTYDAELSLNEINPRLLKFQDMLEPFGQGFPQPRFRIRGNLISDKTMGGGHKRLVFEGDGRQVELVYFSPPSEMVFRPGPYEALVRVQKNYFRQRESLQILIDDARTLV